MSQVIPCNEECWTAKDLKCCVSKCCYVDKMKILEITEFKVEMNLESLVEVFLSTVIDDKKWEPVLRNSVKSCHDKLWGTIDGESCGFIPNSLFAVISCVYTENFLHCPHWNPNELSECGSIHDYVKKCLN